jgi:hypothetical protein
MRTTSPRRPVVSTELVHSATTAGAGGDGGP